MQGSGTVRAGGFGWWRSLELSVLSFFTVQSFISIFGWTETSLCNIQPFFFFGSVPLTLGLDAGQIDWKNIRCLVPDTSLSITLTPQRKEKFPLSLLPCSVLCLFSVPEQPLTCEGSLTKMSVTLMCIRVVVSVPLTLPVDWNCCHSKSIRNGS